MRSLNALIYRALQVLLTALIAVMIIPVTLQIFSRFVDFIPRYIWTEEAARFCLIWLIMLGATIAVRDGTHFDVDVLPAPKTAKGKAVGAHRRPRVDAAGGADLRRLRLALRAVRLGPELGDDRHQHAVDPHRVAGRPGSAGSCSCWRRSATTSSSTSDGRDGPA